MSLNEEKSLEILFDLIRNSGGNIDQVPGIWADILDAHAAAYPVIERKKKRRRGTPGVAIGWPAGVTRAEYSAWKEKQLKKGRTDGINPRVYKAERDGALV